MPIQAMFDVVKPTSIHQDSPIIQYGITDEEGTSYTSHGHLVGMTPEQSAAMADAIAAIQVIVDQDAYVKGLLTPPEGWVAPEPAEEPVEDPEPDPGP